LPQVLRQGLTLASPPGVPQPVSARAVALVRASTSRPLSVTSRLLV